MNSFHTIVWDLETVPDLEAAARLHNMVGATDDEVRAAIGTKFQKHPLHKIVCIGALVTRREDDGWHIEALGAPNLSERSEGQLIADFLKRIGELNAQLISFNGNRFDLPVLRYRAMVNRLSALELRARPYFHRYTEDALDLYDVLGSFGGSATTLDATLKVMGLSGKPAGVDGSQVDGLVSEGRIQEVSWYCETDVLGTYRLWLLYELFRGTLTREQYEHSELRLADLVAARASNNPMMSETYSGLRSTTVTDEIAHDGAAPTPGGIFQVIVIDEQGRRHVGTGDPIAGAHAGSFGSLGRDLWKLDLLLNGHTGRLEIGGTNCTLQFEARPAIETSALEGGSTLFADHGNGGRREYVYYVRTSDGTVTIGIAMDTARANYGNSDWL